MVEELSAEEIARRALFGTDDDTKEEAETEQLPILEPVKKEEEPTAASVFGADAVKPPAESALPVIREPEPEPEAPAEETDADEEEEEEIEVLHVNPVPDDGIVRRWYAVHVHSGQEAAVEKALLATAEQEGLLDQITNILVPMEQVAEFKSGQKKVSKRKYFPGYLLAQLPEHPERNPDLWHLIKDTAGVTGFIGSRTEPVPLEDSEVESLIEEIRGERERPRPKVMFEVGERIKIIDGAFANFMGTIGEINEERGKMKVMIEIFERQTSVEVEFWQVEKN